MTGWPTVCTDAYNMLYYGCWDGDNKKGQHMTQYQINENLTWIKGKHTFKFGFKGRQEYNNIVELQQAQGSDAFYGGWTALYDPVGDQAVSYTGSGLATLELGLGSYLSNQYNRGYFYFKQKEIGLYANDTWKVTPRLTLDLGLRWDYWSPYREKYNRLANLDLTTLGTNSMQVVLPDSTKITDIPGIPSGVIDSWTARGLTTVSANDIGFPGALTPNVYSNFGPRIGVAYRISDTWVFRGGYGAYYWPMPLAQLLQSARSNPPLNLRFENSISNKNGASFNYDLTHVPADEDKIGIATVDPTSTQSIPSSSRSFLAMDVNNWKDDKMQEWTFTLEHALPKDMLVKVSYVGNRGSNLQQHWETNSAISRYNYQASTGQLAPTNADLRRVNPNWNLSGSYGVLEHNGFSNAHSFQLDVEKRFSNGLAFQWFYVYTHAMATNDTGGFSFGPASINGNGSTGAFRSGDRPGSRATEHDSRTAAQARVHQFGPGAPAANNLERHLATAVRAREEVRQHCRQRIGRRHRWLANRFHRNLERRLLDWGAVFGVHCEKSGPER